MTARSVAAGPEVWCCSIDGSFYPDPQAQRVRLDLASPVVGCTEAVPTPVRPHLLILLRLCHSLVTKIQIDGPWQGGRTFSFKPPLPPFKPARSSVTVWLTSSQLWGEVGSQGYDVLSLHHHPILCPISSIEGQDSSGYQARCGSDCVPWSSQ